MANIQNMKPVDTSLFKSTTARLLYGFAVDTLQTSAIPVTPLKLKAAIIDTSLGQLSVALGELSDSATIRGVTNEVLERLKAATSPAAKAAYPKLSTDFQAAAESSKTLEAKEADLRKRFASERAKASQTLSAALKENDGNKLAEAQTLLSTFKTQLADIIKAHIRNNALLSRIYTDARDAVPDKTNLPSLPPIPGSEAPQLR